MSEPKEKQYALRLPADLYEKVEQWAKEELRIVNAQIVAILRDAVKLREAARAQGGETEEDIEEPELVLVS